MKYIDTSAFVKYYLEKEKGFEKISKLIDKAKSGKENLTSSFFVIGGAISVFDKWIRLKLIIQEELDAVIKRFLADIKQMTDSGALILEPISTTPIIYCLEIITKHHIPINDAIHLYTALANKSLIKQFVCSDEILIKAAKAEGLEVFNPETDIEYSLLKLKQKTLNNAI